MIVHSSRISTLWLCLLLLSMPAGALAEDTLWDHSVSSEINGLTMTPDGSYILIGGERLRFLAGDGTLLWDESSAACADCSADGHTIARAKGYQIDLFSGEGTVLWQNSLQSECAALALSSDGKRLAVADGPVKVRFYDANGVLKATTDTAGDPDDEDYDPLAQIHEIAFSEKGTYAAVVSSRGLFYYTGAGRKLWAREEGGDGGTAVAVSGSGNEIAAASDAGVRLYNRTGDLLWEEKSRRPITALAISSNGSRVLAGSQDNIVACFDSKTGEALWKFTADGWIRDLAVSENGSRVLAGSMDRQAYLFDGEGNLLGTYTLDGWANHVAISADGTSGVAASPHQVVRLSLTGAATAVVPTTPASSTESHAPTTLSTPVSTTISPTLSTTPLPANMTTPTDADGGEGGGFPLLLLGLLTGAAVVGAGGFRLRGRKRLSVSETGVQNNLSEEMPADEGGQERSAPSDPWDLALDEGDLRETARILSREMTALIKKHSKIHICFTNDAVDACPAERDDLAAFFTMAGRLGYGPEVPEKNEVEALVEMYRSLAGRIESKK
ncbi:WD40 repeat domain-containing protein [Methanofollis aquaemaris]|nr:WD40 repeat domain-containing protein [Methanofollis aquaemaris]